MFKKINLTIIIILVLSNIIFISMYIKSNKNYENGILKVYLLSGKNQNWTVNNYKIIIADNQFKNGGAKIQYIGNKNDLKNLTYYEVNIIKVDRFNEAKKDGLVAKSILSNKVDISIDENLGTGEISNDGKVDLSNYDLVRKYDIYAVIKYQQKDRPVKEEKIKLNVVTSIESDNGEINVSEK